MPVKYEDRLKLPKNGFEEICFLTHNGLKIASGYERVVFGKKNPLIEFSEQRLFMNNIYLPDNQKWKITNQNQNQIEYRSKDYCSVKILFLKNDTELKKGMFYISPFDLKSDIIPVLIDTLRRKHTLKAI